MKIIEQYLKSLNKTDLSEKLSQYSEVITFSSLRDIEVGMLKYDTKPKDKCFLFILPMEQIVSFHTIGMKFSINIFFYNEEGKLDSTFLNVKPGVRSIKSKNKIKYIVED